MGKPTFGERLLQQDCPASPVSYTRVRHLRHTHWNWPKTIGTCGVRRCDAAGTNLYLKEGLKYIQVLWALLCKQVLLRGLRMLSGQAYIFTRQIVIRHSSTMDTKHKCPHGTKEDRFACNNFITYWVCSNWFCFTVCMYRSYWCCCCYGEGGGTIYWLLLNCC